MSTCLLGQTAYQCVCVKMGVSLIPWFRAGQTVGRCFTGPSQENVLVIGYFICPLCCECSFQFYSSQQHGNKVLRLTQLRCSTDATICAALTLHETLRARNRMSSMRKSPVFVIFMREGAFYYAAIAATISERYPGITEDFPCPCELLADCLYSIPFNSPTVVNIGLMAQPDAALQGSAYFFLPR